ncbi:MAG TPA: LysR family transcriptional regulator, partial [Ilumatobacteraceae bacterium]
MQITQGSPVVGQLTIAQLECFVASIDAGSFTGAATTLRVSQPAVAEQIQRLERAVGQSLFARRPRGVALTVAGAELEMHARRVLDAARDAVAFASQSNT